jgi:16S rRNA (cytidine1402-2'-O)-methyltransferase
MLYIVGTPIGNLGDISPRAKEVLASVDRIACEDTRRTGLLLSSIGIKGRLISYHEHNRVSKEEMLLSILEEKQNVALVSDAGMPCISDPGFELVKACEIRNIPVTVIPGPTAFVAALAVSGIDTRRFFYEGFLPVDGKERKQRLQEISGFKYTVVIYEAPHRIIKTLQDFSQIGMGGRRITICRELTKKYEEIIRTTVDEAVQIFSEREPKGEFALVIESCPKINVSVSPEAREKRIRELAGKGLSKKEIASVLSLEWSESKKTIYADAVKMLE